MKPPKELDAIADVVLRYKPAPKSKASKRRAKWHERFWLHRGGPHATQ
jgi:hypothetical protein